MLDNGRAGILILFEHIFLIFFLVLCEQDALPPKEMNPAEKHCRMADVVLCLGTR